MMPWIGRTISKNEAYEVLRKAENAGLVHMTSNMEKRYTYIIKARKFEERGKQRGIDYRAYL